MAAACVQDSGLLRPRPGPGSRAARNRHLRGWPRFGRVRLGEAVIVVGHGRIRGPGRSLGSGRHAVHPGISGLSSIGVPGRGCAAAVAREPDQDDLMTFQIRQLSTADYPFVISVIDQWWGGRQMADKLPRLFFEHFTDTSFAAERDGKLAGFLAGFISQSRPGEAYIHFVVVDPAERGSGLGRLLYQAFFQAAEARGCVLVRAVTSPVNRGSVAFHQRMGFQLEPGDAEVDRIPVASGYDGRDGDRVRFIRSLRGG